MPCSLVLAGMWGPIESSFDMENPLNGETLHGNNSDDRREALDGRQKLLDGRQKLLDGRRKLLDGKGSLDEK